MCSAERKGRRTIPCGRFQRPVDTALKDLSREFDGVYESIGRPPAPRAVLRAQMMQIFYSIRSVHLLMEQLDYNILFH